MIELTDINGSRVLLPIDGVVVEEQPAGQTMIVMPSGYIIQVKEDVEEVRQLIEKERAK